VSSSNRVARWAYGGVFALVCLLLLYLLRGVLTPVLVAFALAYLLDPAVDRLEALRVPRSLGIAVLLLVSLTALGLGTLLLAPIIARDLAALASELPAAASRLLARLDVWLGDQGVQLPHSGQEALAALQQHAQSVAPNAVAMARSGALALVGGTVSVASAVAALLIVPVLAFYLLRDFDLMTAATVELLPARLRERSVEMAREVDVVLGQFVRGQLIVMAILGGLYAVGFSLIGVRLAVPIGIVGGLLSFIPYVGSAIALALALIMTALHLGGLAQFAGVVIVYSVIQTLEGFVITPRIVGDKLGLSPVWVLLALMAGGELFGFMGVMLALPLAAVVKVFAEHGLRRYKLSRLWSGRRTSVPAPSPTHAPLRLLRLRPRRAQRRRARAVR
jgi:predicted PurR-regulated permease PerM